MSSFRGDANNGNLRSSAYEAVMELIKNSAKVTRDLRRIYGKGITFQNGILIQLLPCLNWKWMIGVDRGFLSRIPLNFVVSLIKKINCPRAEVVGE